MSREIAPPRSPDVLEVADAFGLGRIVAEPVIAARGEMGRIWRLETTTGRWALKEVFRPQPDAADWAVADASFQMAARAAGIPMPRPIIAADGRVLIEVGPVEHRRSVRLYSWVDLRSREAHVPIRDAAAILGRLHGLAIVDRRAPDPWFHDPVPVDHWPATLEAARSAGAPWASALERLIPTLGAAVDVAGDADGDGVDAITCHLDFNPENVLLDVAGRPVVVDWENSGPASPEQELASAVAEFVADPSETATFLRAYAGTGGSGRLMGRPSFRMTLVVQAALIRTYSARALDASFTDEDRARSAFWIDDIAAHAFTLDRIDGWLEEADRAGLLAPA